MSFAKTEVRPYRGVPTIFVDDQPIQGMTATSCAFGDPQVVKDFVSAGCEIMMIWIEFGIKCWKGPGQYDWTYAEEKLRFFEENSADTKWIIRVRLGLLDGWFREQYPSEVHNPPTPGQTEERKMTVANIASSVWCREVCELTKAFVAWLKTTKWAPRIIGFMLNAGATEEWLVFDADKTYHGHYHGVYTREFQAFLKKKYQTPAALQQAWNDPQVSFESASCPSGRVRSGSHIWGPYSLRDPATDRPAIDYYYFLNNQLADNFIAICRAAKETAGTPILVGGFHSYLWWETGVYSYIQEYGHGLIQKLNECPYIDFISDITSYDDRYAGGVGGYIGLPQSQNLHNKLHYTEADYVTYSQIPEQYRQAWAKIDPATVPLFTAEPAIPDPVWRWDVNYAGRDVEEQVALFQRQHMQSLLNGTAYWWFDIRSHNYQHPAFIKGLKQLSDIGKKAVHWDRRSIAQVAFVVSEDTPMYQAAMNGSLMRFELESIHTLLNDLCNRRWGSAGIPYDIYELHDLAHPDFPGDQYKLIIFLNAGFISKKAAAGIRRWQNNGRTLLWTYAAGVFSEQRLDPALSADLLGMRLGMKKQRRNIHVMIDDNGSPLTRGGAQLNFGVEGSVGPVMFVDDPSAQTLGHLRDGGEVGFALKKFPTWNSLYLGMINFQPNLFRNLARFAGAHVWMDSNDVLYANRSAAVLHTAAPGEKIIRLPAKATVTDLWTNQTLPAPTDTIRLENAPPYRTWAWKTDYV